MGIFERDVTHEHLSFAAAHRAWRNGGLIMEMRKEIRSFGKGLLKLRQQLQDGRVVTRKEYLAIKSDLEALLLDLEMNHKRERHRTH